MACQRCGVSCEGVRVALAAHERDAVLARARALGVRFPEEGGALRRVGGRCVLYDDGCRLHAAFGAAAKPEVCQQYPYVRAGREVAAHPGCPHAEGFGPGAARLGVDAPGAALPPTLREQAEVFGLTLEDAARRWSRVPWAAWAEPVDVGPTARAVIPQLRAWAPPTVWVDWPAGGRAVARGARLRLTADPADWWVGATVIAAAPAAERARWFAVWVRGERFRITEVDRGGGVGYRA